MKKQLFLTLLLMLAVVTTTWAQTRIIAHRGYWDCAGSAQNSIASLEAANRIGVYGSEFDVHITKDGVTVVYHDDQAVSADGKDTIDIETADYAQLRHFTLMNGEEIPTLQQYLEAGKKLHCQLILEIKAHRDRHNEERCVREVVRQIKATGMLDRVEFISFSLYECELVHELLPYAKVAYLNGELSPQQLKDKGFTGMDYWAPVYAQHPEWIKECHRLGLSVNVWTVNDLNAIEQFIEAGVDFITTNRPVASKRLAH